MKYENFVEQVRLRSGLGDSDVDVVIRRTLSLLGKRLRHVDARAVAERLPPELAEHLLREPEDHPFDLAQPESERQMRAVCRVLAETLDEQGRAQLRMQPLTSLFVH